MTRTVPAAVPSLFQSPVMPSLATKKSSPLTGVILLGREGRFPARMFLTKTVPAAVPSLFQNSSPLTPSSALKNNWLLKMARLRGLAVECQQVVHRKHESGEGRTIAESGVRAMPVVVVQPG